MDDAPPPGPSLLLAGHENAHREHLLHQHNKFHRRRDTAEATTVAVASIVTEVIQTVSVVQQIDVDSNGNTFSVLTVLQEPTPGAQTALTPVLPLATSNVAPAASHSSSGPSSTVVESSSDTNSTSLVRPSSGRSATTASTSTPSIPATSASLIISSNSTNFISGPSSLFHNFTNSSSILSSSRTPLTYLKSPSSSSTSYLSRTSTYSSDPFTSSTDFAGIVAGGTGTAANAPTSTAATTTESGTKSNPTSNSSPVSTPTVVGGVVGSVAGVAVIALLLLFIMKWRKNRNGALLSLGSGRDGAGDGVDIVPGEPPSQPSERKVERQSFIHAVPAALASLTGYKRSSKQTDRTISSTAGSEKGFYRVSGRKLPSVFTSGGDGYGGGVPDHHTLSGSSFYRDSQGFYGGPGSPTLPSLERYRESGQIGTPVMRPSPARTPVTEQGFFAMPSPPPQTPLPPRPDVLGRSRLSQDGSQPSRFTEEV